MNPFDNLFGNPEANTTRGDDPLAEIRAQAAEQNVLAREISEALQARDVVRAESLIQEGEQLFGRAAMVDAVQLQASQDRMQAMEAAGERYRREADLGEQADVYYDVR